ncbi:LysR family transcriptional regulator [Colwellia sp. MB02u-18]|uniref:LysR family transcriptional regulator n=1 Tax=unclassified Colwellia TaxID=196834 RepID=UPI0015F45823|nr:MULTISPECIES: LysR family transcriptional regulator [unclassified Colwellia]MBA6224850.1 LysR family transcriptional regulator [Colwellia sp. MB3u-45]MBA6268862.1 LysR family transcriptional regulator [Colwellia sp. MB3u-43]MBA6296217.1 LysR family transcriptional regulator [Colwellia sp. MB02u-9]MBA6321293.1 LysR family transcriptional regulator [Colwellia sp. MB02u-19]MBA6325846.1 LysR family transcriptional regulator [Colwellia sp. MB02u-18]
MDISFEQLKSMVVFSHVVEQGSFSAAAKHIGLSRAVVSYHIKKLETQLGITLLNRSTRSIALTQAGNDYYQRCHIIAQQASAANQQIENVKNEPEGRLKITCPVSVGLHTIVPALDKFRHIYPKIELDIMLTDEVVNIVKEGIDLAIRGAPLADSGLQARKLAVLATCLCGSPDYFEQYGRPEKPSELSQHNWVVYKLASNKLTLEKSGRSYTVDIKGTITTNNATARTAFVEGGHGLGRIPTYDAWPKIKAGRLQTVLDDYQLKAIDVYGVFPPGAATSKKLRLLIDFLEQFFDQQQARLLIKNR